MDVKNAAFIGRVLLLAGFLSLLGAWMTQWTGQSLFGMSQAHLFSDATVLALLGIGALLDAKLHRQEI